MYTLEPVYEACNNGKMKETSIMFFSKINPNETIFKKQNKVEKQILTDKSDDISYYYNELESLVLDEKNDDLLMRIKMKNSNQIREFMVPKDMFFILTSFIEKFIYIGVLIPNYEVKYSFLFYEIQKSNYFHIPDIQLCIDEFENLDKMWDYINNYFSEYIVLLSKSHFLLERGYPAGFVERTIVNIQKDKINKEINECPAYKEIKKEEIDQLFDKKGKIIDPELFRNRLYFAGIELSLLEEVLPFILGLYPYDSTFEDRNIIDEKCKNDFQIYYEQMKSQLPEQIKNQYKKDNTYRVIKHDVERTDRNIPLFKNKDGIGLKIIRDLLQTYSIYNPQVCYLQGMNDLMVPIILTYITNVNDDGIPINKDGTIMDYKVLYPKLFWLFDALLKNTGHISFLISINTNKVRNLEIITEIIKSNSPIIFEWLKNNDLLEYQWIYSEYILLFKRTFGNIWRIWLALNCSIDSVNWMPYLIAAIIIDSFNEIALMSQVSIIKMMSQFPKILQQIDVDRISKIAFWIYNKNPVYISNRIEDDEQENFDFFELK